MRLIAPLCCLVLAMLLSVPARASAVYMTQAELVASAFSRDDVAAQLLWISGSTKRDLQTLLKRQSVGLRQRYWRDENRTVWVFNEVGKEMPITIGVVVESPSVQEAAGEASGRSAAIVQLAVLEYRESRGGEVRHPFFTRQFIGAALDRKHQLDRHIDGISGATLSVRAMQRVARAALYLHASVVDQADGS